MSEIFREVDEEVRKEQYLKLWKKYGPAVIAVAVAIVVAVGGYQGWQAYRLQAREDASAHFAEALSKAAADDKGAAIAALDEVVQEDGGGYGLLAAFQSARLRAESGDRDGAVAIWSEIAKSDAAPAMRELATLLSVQHRLDSGDPATLEAELGPLTGPSGHFRAAALELSALLAMRRGDNASARALLQQVTDDLEAPQGARARAAQLLSTLPE